MSYNNRHPATFTLTEDHVKLLGRSYFEWEDGPYSGSVAQDPKRPYGNTDVLGDVYEVTRGGIFWDYDKSGEMPGVLVDQLVALHRQMATVVQIAALSLAKGFPFKAGMTYRLAIRYDALSWEPVTE